MTRAAPVGYRWLLNPRPSPITLHLALPESRRTLCGWGITRSWTEPTITQRTKCRTCWMAWAKATGS